MDSFLSLELFWWKISGYHMMFYDIWSPSIPLCVFNWRLFSLQYYVMSFVFYQKQNVWAFNIILGVTSRKLALTKWIQPSIQLTCLIFLTLIFLTTAVWLFGESGFKSRRANLSLRKHWHNNRVKWRYKYSVLSLAYSSE